MEALEEPNEGEDEEEDGEEFEPFIGEHSRDTVVRSNVDLGVVRDEGDVECAIVGCCLNCCADGAFDLLHIPPISYLGSEVSIEDGIVGVRCTYFFIHKFFQVFRTFAIFVSPLPKRL